MRDVPVSRQAGVDPFEPLTRAGERGEGGLLGGDADAEAVPLEGPRARLDVGRRPGQHPDPKLRQREALAEAANHDHVVAEPERRRERGAVPERRLVRLVGDDDEPVAFGQRDRGGDVFAAGDVAGRVAGIAEQECPRSRSDLLLERLEVPPPAACRGSGDVDRYPSGGPDRAAEEEAR